MTVAKTATLAGALVAAHKEMPAVAKTGTGNFGAHITLDHLIAQTRQHLAKNGLSIIQLPCVLETGQPALRTTLMHESGESLSADAPLFLGDRQTMQALGSALTYARRQGWSAVLGISTEADDDGDSVSLPPAPSGASKPAAAGAFTAGAAGTPGAGAAGTDGSAKAAPAPPTTTELRAQYETLARSWARMEQTFDATAAVKKADEKLASAKAANDAEPYRKFLTAQVESFMALINRRNADLEAAAAFPIPETNLEAAGKA